MKILKYPDRKDWDSILQRPTFDDSSLNNTVQDVLNEIKDKGDEAVLK